MTPTRKTAKLTLRATVVTATAAACLIGLLVSQAQAGKHTQLVSTRADGTGRQITHLRDSPAPNPENDLKKTRRVWDATLNGLGLPASSPLGGALRIINKLEGPQRPSGPDVATYRHGIWSGPNGKPISDQTAAARAYAGEHHLPMVVKIPQGAKVKVSRKAIAVSG